MIAPPIPFLLGTPGGTVDASGLASSRTFIWVPSGNSQVRVDASANGLDWCTRATFGIGQVLVFDDLVPYYRAYQTGGTGGKLYLVGEPAAPGSVLGESTLATDTSSATAAFTPLVQVNFALAVATVVEITANLAANKTGATGQVQARIRVNGGGPPFPINIVGNLAASSAAVYRVSLPAGAYTAALEWFCAGGSTRQCLPVTAPNEQRAYMLIKKEV